MSALPQGPAHNRPLRLRPGALRDGATRAHRPDGPADLAAGFDSLAATVQELTGFEAVAHTLSITSRPSLRVPRTAASRSAVGCTCRPAAATVGYPRGAWSASQTGAQDVGIDR